MVNGNVRPRSIRLAGYSQARRRYIQAALAVVCTTLCTTSIAAQYLSRANTSSPLCRALVSDIKRAKVESMTDEELCALDTKKLFSQFKFYEWKPAATVNADEFYDAISKDGHLIDDKPSYFDKGLRSFVAKALKDGAASVSTSTFTINGHSLVAHRIDIDSCKSFDPSGARSFKHLYREQLGLPAYHISMDGQSIPFTNGPEGKDIGFSSRTKNGFLGIDLDRAWATVNGNRQISVEVIGYALNIPKPDSTDSLDIRAHFKPYFWAATECDIVVRVPVKETHND